MIRPLRRRHDAMIGVLALVVPVLFALTLVARPSEATWLGAVPPTFVEGPDGVRLLTDRDVPARRPLDPPAPLPLDAGRLVGVHTSGDMAWLDVETGDLPDHPGLLLAWVPDAEAVRPGEADPGFTPLPRDAHLIGALRARAACRYPLPADALAGTGALLLYSLGHQTVVGEPRALDAAVLGEPLPDARDDGSADR